MVEGISHLTFIVKDLERASTFFKFIFGAEEKYSSGDKTFSLSREKFNWQSLDHYNGRLFAA